MAPAHTAAPLDQWVGFHLALLLLLAAEFAFSRWRLPAPGTPERIRRQHRNALAATAMWIAVALTFAGYVFLTRGGSASTQFLAGYAIEESLSIDNLFVFLLLFRVFAIPPSFQPRVLFWGVLGAMVLRGIFISAGVRLLERFEWVSYIFAIILLVAAARLVLPGESPSPEHPKTPFWIRWISRIHPVAPRHDRFFVREDGHARITMLFLALVAIEAADIVFALDSIPAVLSITRNPFLAYTSNILAVMGLRSLFFLLAQMLRQLRFLHLGLAAILAFAALRMLAAPWVELSPMLSLAIILTLLGLTIGLSLLPAPSATQPK